jgi:nucleotide-binding universal stress UspA family protein
MRPARVVVGVDGSPHSLPALRWAAAEAARRGIPLDVIHAFHTRWAVTPGPPGRLSRTS